MLTLAGQHTRWVAPSSRLGRRDPGPDVGSLRGFRPLPLSGRYNAPVSLGVGRSGFDVVVRLLPTLRTWALTLQKARSSLTPAARARDRAAIHLAMKNGMPGRLPDTGFSCCTVADAVTNGACATPVPRECEPRSSRPPCDDRSFARADGTEKRNSTRRRIEPRLVHRRAPFVTGNAVVVGWRSPRRLRATGQDPPTNADPAKGHTVDEPGCHTSSFARPRAGRRFRAVRIREDCSPRRIARAGRGAS